MVWLGRVARVLFLLEYTLINQSLVGRVEILVATLRAPLQLSVTSSETRTGRKGRVQRIMKYYSQMLHVLNLDYAEEPGYSALVRNR